MARKNKTFRGLKRDNSKVHCYCYFCIGSKKFDSLHNRALNKRLVHKELIKIDGI